MNKRFFNALLLGAVVLSTGTFVSCDNDDVDDLKSRVSVIEVAIDVIKTQLSKALMTGASITKVDESNGTYTLTLRDGQKIVIKPGGGNISIVVTDTEAIITIEGEEYILPLGSLVNSLIYSPETIDGIVEIGNTATTVNFLARPALKSLDGAEFTIAESHVLTRAADGEQFKVSGDVTLEGDFIKVPIKALGEAEAGKTYAVSLQLNLKGTIIGSNYFTVKVSDDFSSIAEDLGGVTIKADYNPQDLADGFKEMTINGLDLLKDLNFKDLFSELPERAEFAIAAASKQPGGKAQEKIEMLKSSLKADGTWKFSERPGTSFNENTDRSGFLINVLADDIVKAKIYVVVTDPLAVVADDVFKGSLKGLGEPHVEYGEMPAEGTNEGAPVVFAPGVNSLNLYDVIANGKLSLKHGEGGAKIVEALQGYIAEVDGDNLVYSDGSSLVVDDFGKQLQGNVVYYNRQTSIASSQRRSWTMSDDEKKAFAGAECNGEILNGFDGLNGSTMVANGLKITNEGNFETTEAYGGWALRVGFGVRFEYAYGSRDISDGCLCFLWINRRDCAEGVVDNPTKIEE